MFWFGFSIFFFLKLHLALREPSHGLVTAPCWGKHFKLHKLSRITRHRKIPEVQMKEIQMVARLPNID